MDTKKAIERLYERIGYDDSISVNTDDKLTYTQNMPYGKKDFRFNAFFWFCSQFLQPGTNMLIIIDDEGNPMPMSKPILLKLSYCKCSSTFNKLYNRLLSDGLISYMKGSHLERIYMNPAFVIKGNSFSKFLLDMFMISADKMMGEHLFAVAGTRYNLNRRSIKNESK